MCDKQTYFCTLFITDTLTLEQRKNIDRIRSRHSIDLNIKNTLLISMLSWCSCLHPYWTMPFRLLGFGFWWFFSNSKPVSQKVQFRIFFSITRQVLQFTSVSTRHWVSSSVCLCWLALWISVSIVFSASLQLPHLWAKIWSITVVRTKEQSQCKKSLW